MNRVPRQFVGMHDSCVSLLLIIFNDGDKYSETTVFGRVTVYACACVLQNSVDDKYKGYTISCLLNIHYQRLIMSYYLISMYK